MNFFIVFPFFLKYLTNAAKLTREEIIKLLLATYKKGRTVLHVAADYNEIQTSQEILK
jgi:hypothetical protein